jgi:lipase
VTAAAGVRPQPVPAAEPIDVAVLGGTLRVGQWPGAGPNAPAVLALHGITASHLAWVEVARRLPGRRIVAPDLRGRGRSRGLPGPYGMDRHAADMATVLDALGCRRVVVVGHSMGGFVAVALAAHRPDLVSRLVLVDGGLPLDRRDAPPPPGGIDATLGPAAARLAMTFPSREAYRDFWRRHPALGPIWGPAVQAYVDYDLVGEPPELRSACRVEAMRVDGAEVGHHAARAARWEAVRAPVTFLRAERGLLDAPPPFYPADLVSAWTETGPAVTVETVADANHYSLLLGEPGAAAVARAVGTAADLAGEERQPNQA